jgi:hypothetical protein
MISKGIVLRRSMRIPRHLMGAPLSPFLPHATTTLLTPLSPRTVFRYPMFLRGLRFCYFLASTEGQNSDRCCYPGAGCLELELLVTFDIRLAVD